MEAWPGGQRLTPCAEPDRQAALAIVTAFAEANGWSRHIPALSRIDVLVAPDRAALEAYLRAEGELEGPAPPALLATALAGRIVLAEAAAVAGLRPEYLAVDNGWVRILAHEYVHLLHELIVGGDPARLGPEWFFEGFACVGAGQRLGRSFVGAAPAAVIAALAVEGRQRYAVYDAAVRFFAGRHGLPALIANAAATDFETWLLDRA